MAKMKAAMAAVLVMEKEGVSQAFGVPGAAINPLYSALRERGGIAHVLARHVEAASHMAEGYTRARACTRRTSRRWTSSPSPSRSQSGRSRCASRRRCRAPSSRPST